jgi:phosphoglycerate dehydrogenase-like enzyme
MPQSEPIWSDAMPTDILVLSDDAEAYLPLLQTRVPQDCRLLPATDAESLPSAAAEAEIALAKPSLLAEALPRLPALRWAQSTYAGVDPLLREDVRKDYLLTGVKDVFGPLMSEYVFGWILALERDLFTLDAQQRQRRWSEIGYRGLAGVNLGVAGLGSIGRHIAATGRHFGMRVTGYRRSPGSVDGVDRVYSDGEFGRFVIDLDYLVLTLPNTPATHHLLGADAIAAMPARARVINVGRGGVVDADALAEALHERRIAGAVLDVFEEEPLPRESPLWTLPGCHVTPHVAARSFPADIAAIFTDNLRRYLDGRELCYRVDFERGY